MKLFHKFVNGLTQIVDGILVSCADGIHHAVTHMVLEDYFAGVVQSGAHRSQLNQNIRAVVSFLHHPLHLFQVTDGPGKAVYHRFLIFVNVTVGMSDAVGMLIDMLLVVEMVMGMVVHGFTIFPQCRFLYIISPFPFRRKPSRGILQEK